MFLFITDSIYFYQKNKDFTFKNDLFKWKINNDANELMLHKTLIDKKLTSKIEESDIIGIISPSNYKLLFDLKELNIKKIYIPEFYDKRKNFKIDYNKIDKLFENYLKRSYISFLNYEKLRNIGLNRIEQFIIIQNIIGYQNFKNYDNLKINNSFTIKEIKDLNDETVTIKRLNMIPFINLMTKKYQYSFDAVSKFIIQQYGKLTISDPFNEDGFIFLKKPEDYPELFNIALSLLKTEIKVYKKKLIIELDTGKKQDIIVRIPQDKISEDIIRYHGLQTENYFVGKRVIPEVSDENLSLIFNNLKNIIPLKDIILTMKSLVKLNKIENKFSHFKTKEYVMKKINIKKNIRWIAQDTWKDIYSQPDFSFNNIINEIETESLEFNCPCCDSTSFSTTPLRYFCKNNQCNFTFDRISLSIVEVNPIQEEKMLEALTNKKIFVKNKNGKNFVSYLRNNEDYYFLSLKEE